MKARIYFLITYISVVAISFMIIGCSSTKTICPAYPNPSKKTVKLLIENDIVWLEKQYKLKLKLKACND